MKANFYRMILDTKAFFEVELPAQLRLLETEVGGITLPDPVKHIVGYEDLFSGKCPRICYVSATAAAEAESQGEYLANPLITILAAFTNEKPDVLEQVLLLYTDAFANAVESDEGLGGACDISQIETIDWGHPGGDDKTKAVLALGLRLEKNSRP